MVRVRTDGKRLFVYTNSGQNDLKEAYAWTVSPAGEAVPDSIRKA